MPNSYDPRDINRVTPIGMTQKGEYVSAEDVVSLKLENESLKARVTSLELDLIKVHETLSRLQGQTHLHGDGGISKIGLPPLQYPKGK